MHNRSVHGQEACEKFTQIRADMAEDPQESSASARHHLSFHRRRFGQIGHTQQHHQTTYNSTEQNAGEEDGEAA